MSSALDIIEEYISFNTPLTNFSYLNWIVPFTFSSSNFAIVLSLQTNTPSSLLVKHSLLSLGSIAISHSAWSDSSQILCPNQPPRHYLAFWMDIIRYTGFITMGHGWLEWQVANAVDNGCSIFSLAVSILDILTRRIYSRLFYPSPT